MNLTVCLPLCLRQTGLLIMGPEKSESFQTIKNTLQRNKVPTVVLNRDNFSQHIPNVNLAEGDGAVVDVTAGVLYADRALKTAQVQRQHGCCIRSAERLTAHEAEAVNVSMCKRRKSLLL